MSYRHTGEETYLRTAQKVCRNFLSRIPENGAVPVDLCQDPELDWEDSTAAAIAACGMLELWVHSAPEEGEFFREQAVKLLRFLSESRSNWDTDIDPILENGSVAYWDEKHNFPMIYGDYFFTEAILRRCGKDTFLWG